jgi:membrane-associated protease RseP (regulator of RpoE activity)
MSHDRSPCPPPRAPARLLLVACLLLGAACGTAAHAAPPAPAPPRPAKKLLTIAPGEGGFPTIRARRGHLGVELVEITPELREHFGAPKEAGVLVARVLPDGPAAKAGVKVGDVITGVDGQAIGDDTDLRRKIRDKKDKEVASLEILRNRARQTLKAEIQQKETSELDLASLGKLHGKAFKLEVDPDRINRLVDRAMRDRRVLELNGGLERRRELEERLQQRTEALEQRLERLEKELGARKK